MYKAGINKVVVAGTQANKKIFIKSIQGTGEAGGRGKKHQEISGKVQGAAVIYQDNKHPRIGCLTSLRSDPDSTTYWLCEPDDLFSLFDLLQ
jgi:hypothetical protein